MAGSPFGAAATTSRPAPAATAAPAAVSTAKASSQPDPTTVRPMAARPAPVSADPYAASAPKGISGRQAKDFLGQLIVVLATDRGVMHTIIDPNSEFVRVDIIALTAPEDFVHQDGTPFEEYAAGDRFDNVLVYNRALVREWGDAYSNGTGWLLGRLEMGRKKPGQNAPFIFVEGSEDDWNLYRAWVAEQKKVAK